MKYNKNKKVSRRARVDPTVDRNEFIRLRRTEDLKAPGVSGAPADAKEVKKQVKKQKKIEKTFFPKAPVVLPEVPVDSSAEKPRSRRKPRKVRASPSLWVPENLSRVHREFFSEAEEEMQRPADVADVLRAESPIPDAQQAAFDPDAEANRMWRDVNWREMTISADGELTFAEPAYVVPAEVAARRHLLLGLVVSKILPVHVELLPQFVEWVQGINFDTFHLRKVVSSKVRQLVVRDLRQCFDCTRDDADRLLQMSYMTCTRFVTGDRQAAVEHYAIASAIGRILLWGQTEHLADAFLEGDLPYDGGDLDDDAPPDGDGDADDDAMFDGDDADAGSGRSHVGLGGSRNNPIQLDADLSRSHASAVMVSSDDDCCNKCVCVGNDTKELNHSYS